MARNQASKEWPRRSSRTAFKTAFVRASSTRWITLSLVRFAKRFPVVDMLRGLMRRMFPECVGAAIPRSVYDGA